MNPSPEFPDEEKPLMNLNWFNLPLQIALGIALAGIITRVLTRLFG